MQQVLSSTAGRPSPAPAGYRVDLGRGERVGRVSSEWFSRPADERFMSLSDLHRSVKRRADRSRARTVESREVRVEARRNDGDRLSLVLPGEPEPVAPTHWSFGQLAGLVGAPAGYLRGLPASIAGINLQYGLSHHRAEMVKTYTTEDGRTELRAVTGPDYGRIHDHKLVDSVMRIAGNGTCMMMNGARRGDVNAGLITGQRLQEIVIQVVRRFVASLTKRKRREGICLHVIGKRTRLNLTWRQARF